MANAYESAISQKALLAVFKKMYNGAKPASRNTVGVDSISINDFLLNQNHHIARLHRTAVSEGHSFSALKPFLIPKKDKNKDRLICVPTVNDRIIQRALLNFLSKKYRKILINQVSYGFIEGRSVKQAAARAIELRTKSPWTFKTDITSFFDKIPRNTLKEKFRELIKEKSLYSVLDGVIDCEIQETSTEYNRRISRLGIKNGHGIRQGMPLSPFFANVILKDFDAAIINNGWNSVRYADDLVFFSETKSECEDIALMCRELLANVGLEIPDIAPDSKSQIFMPSAAAEFLGLYITPIDGGYDLQLSLEQKNRILRDFLSMASIKELLARKITFGSLQNTFRAKKDGYLAAYDCCSNYAELENELEHVVKKALGKIYRDELRIPVNELSDEARGFLFR